MFCFVRMASSIVMSSMPSASVCFSGGLGGAAWACSTALCYTDSCVRGARVWHSKLSQQHTRRDIWSSPAAGEGAGRSASADIAKSTRQSAVVQTQVGSAHQTYCKPIRWQQNVTIVLASFSCSPKYHGPVSALQIRIPAWQAVTSSCWDSLRGDRHYHKALRQRHCACSCYPWG